MCSLGPFFFFFFFVGGVLEWWGLAGVFCCFFLVFFCFFFFFFFMCDTKRSKGMSLVTYSDAALWLWPCAKVDVRWGLAQVRAVTVTNQLCRTP